MCARAIPVSYTHLDVYKRQGLGYGLLTGAEQAEESSSAAGVAAFAPTGAVSVICYENEGGEIALEYLDDTWTLRRDADFPVNQTLSLIHI